MFMQRELDSEIPRRSVPYGGTLPIARATSSPAISVCSRSAGESPYTITVT
jgi:hypothetical protein